MAVVTFWQLEEDEHDFINYLAKTGEVWAISELDDSGLPQYAPSPILDCFQAYVWNTRPNSLKAIYMGSRNDILSPEISEFEKLEGYELAPEDPPGSGVRKMIGGTKVKRKKISIFDNNFMHYSCGNFPSSGTLTPSNLYYYPGTWKGHPPAYHTRSPEFLRLAKATFAWIRRHAPSKIQVPRSTVPATLPATLRAANAIAAGIKYDSY